MITHKYEYREGGRCTGADGLKGAIARLWETRAECPGVLPVIFCHDEIVLEVAEADANRAAEWLKRCMVEAVAPVIEPVPGRGRSHDRPNMERVMSEHRTDTTFTSRSRGHAQHPNR